MLSKQVWRILLFPNSLLSQVLHARYFRDGEVFSAKRGRNPSFTWRSLHAAIDIVRGWFRWGIGSGRSVKVWQDPWLPRPFSFHILTPPGANDPHLRVCDLIDDSSKDWNQTLVWNLFWHDEAESILAIRSALWRGRTSSFGTTPQPVCFLSRVRTMLLSLWPTGTNRNALPTGSNLFKKLRDVVLVCPYCGSEEEDTEHVFLRCPFMRQVWALSNLRWSFISNYPADPCGWVEFLAQTLSRDDFACGISICWAIWWNRNRALMEQSYFSAGDLLSFDTNYLASFKQLTASSSKVTHQAPPRWGLGSLLGTLLGRVLDGNQFVSRLFDPEMVEAMLLEKQFCLPVGSGNKVAHCLARRASLFASEGSSISPALFELLFSEVE
ncbi:UNVERIFIED_CONTAM: hypothetical protein Sradi_4562800 [Sesamum radiatum]|uniref:Reverse transcriptase zinc-binding domain-containing protein n=1 Tax=Sesamum radiatum TaxID=300843 RepID=A0AAW2NAB6_SESRA